MTSRFAPPRLDVLLERIERMGRFDRIRERSVQTGLVMAAVAKRGVHLSDLSTPDVHPPVHRTAVPDRVPHRVRALFAAKAVLIHDHARRMAALRLELLAKARAALATVNLLHDRREREAFLRRGQFPAVI
jgi:hypothetical protein